MDGQDDEARYDTLEILALLGWWTGNLGAVEHYSSEMLALGERLDRKDLAALALTSLIGVAMSRLEDERAEELLAAGDRARRGEREPARAHARRSDRRATSPTRRGDLDAAAEAYERARELASEAGATASLAGILRHLASVMERQGETARAEKLLRDAIRMLRQMDRRGTLVEALRALAELLLREGKIDEAERFALEAREVLTPRDITSRITTTTALALVREAQGRDEEAEALFRDAIELLGETQWRSMQRKPLRAFARFLTRARPRRRGAAATRSGSRSWTSGARLGRDRVQCAARRRAHVAAHRRAAAPPSTAWCDSSPGDSLITVAGPLEAAQRLAERLRAQRALAVGQVLRLVAVRVGDVGEVDVERRARLAAARRRARAPRRTRPRP